MADDLEKEHVAEDMEAVTRWLRRTMKDPSRQPLEPSDPGLQSANAGSRQTQDAGPNSLHSEAANRTQQHGENRPALELENCKLSTCKIAAFRFSLKGTKSLDNNKSTPRPGLTCWHRIWLERWMLCLGWRLLEEVNCRKTCATSLYKLNNAAESARTGNPDVVVRG